jgi:hypothetical protein
VSPKNSPKTAQANFFFVSKSIVQVIGFEARNNSWAPKSTTTVSPPIETFPFRGQWLESIGQKCLRENHRKGNHIREVCVCVQAGLHTPGSKAAVASGADAMLQLGRSKRVKSMDASPSCDMKISLS